VNVDLLRIDLNLKFINWFTRLVYQIYTYLSTKQKKLKIFDKVLYYFYLDLVTYVMRYFFTGFKFNGPFICLIRNDKI